MWIASPFPPYAPIPFYSPAQIKLELSNKELNEETLSNPLFVVENYVFSNLRNDAIRVENGSLQRGLLSISCSDSSDTVNLLPRMQFSWKFAEMPEALVESYDPSLQQAIALYRQSVNVRVLLSPLSL